MFGKKREQKDMKAAPEVTASVEVIPDIFYGGTDPDIYSGPASLSVEKKTVETMKKNSSLAVVGETVPELPNLQTVARMAPSSVTENPNSSSETALTKPAASHKALLFIIGGVVLLGAIGAGAFVFLSPPKVPTEPETVVQQTQNTDTLNQTVTEPVLTSSSTEPVIASPTSTLFQTQFIEFPSLIFALGSDQDADALTDEEEGMFATDSGVWDSDKDGYYDGQEVFNLYNPNGFAPQKLIDSGLVREYIQPLFQYHLYYPLNWEADTVDTDQRIVLLSNLSGDYVEVRVVTKGENETFADWFARNAPTQSFTDLVQQSNRFKVEGWKRKDNMVSYFVAPKEVYVLVYHPREQGVIHFPYVFSMVSQSFRLPTTTTTLPVQSILPGTSSTIPVSSVSSTSSTSTL